MGKGWPDGPAGADRAHVVPAALSRKRGFDQIAGVRVSADEIAGQAPPHTVAAGGQLTILNAVSRQGRSEYFFLALRPACSMNT